MSLSNIPKMRRDGQITLLDGTGTPVTLDINYEEGALSIDNVSIAVEDQTVIRDRSAICTVRKGDAQPISGSFTAYFRQFTSGSVGAILDFINKDGAYNANISTAATGSPYVEFYTVDIKYTSLGNTLSLGDDADSTATLTRCVVQASFSEGDPSAFTLNFTSYGSISFTGTT